MNSLLLLHSKSITIHLVAWALALLCLGLAAVSGAKLFFLVFILAMTVAFVAGFVALPVALASLFQSGGMSPLLRLQYAAVAVLAASTLVGGIVFRVLTAGRH